MHHVNWFLSDDVPFSVGDTFVYRAPFEVMVGKFRVIESFVGCPIDNLDKCERYGEYESSWA